MRHTVFFPHETVVGLCCPHLSVIMATGMTYRLCNTEFYQGGVLEKETVQQKQPSDWELDKLKSNCSYVLFSVHLCGLNHSANILLQQLAGGGKTLQQSQTFHPLDGRKNRIFHPVWCSVSTGRIHTEPRAAASYLWVTPHVTFLAPPVKPLQVVWQVTENICSHITAWAVMCEGDAGFVPAEPLKT